MTEKERADTPAVFAGTKYYEILMETRKLMRDAAVAENYSYYVTLAYQFFTLSRSFITETHAQSIKKKLIAAQLKLDTWRPRMNSIKYDTHADVASKQVRDLLRDVEEEMELATKDLKLKTSKGDSLDLDFEKLAEGG